ncbi:MAG: O-methyltransferase, partial [Phycisphaerae bacterium]|nr:O-methyltransferase [Phycisphaerae bacterium]
MEKLWSDVDDYLIAQYVQPDDALNRALADSHAAGLPEINVSPAQGKFLHLLAKMIGAKSILEIGTLGGYSTIWLARALAPNGKMITLEFDPKHADVAKKNIARAGVADRVELKLGRAIDILPTLAGPFDLIFIDADKTSTA